MPYRYNPDIELLREGTTGRKEIGTIQRDIVEGYSILKETLRKKNAGKIFVKSFMP